MTSCATRDLVVHTLAASRSRGVAGIGGLMVPCALGRSGQSVRKREGDGASPIGAWALEFVLFRADRRRRPRTVLPCMPITPDMGWCDEPMDRNYNRAVRHPYRASAERLWRDDDVYDIVVVTGHNMVPRVRGAGSAIFLHQAREGFAPTAGCLALAPTDLVRVLQCVDAHSRLVFPG